ncbi:RluA family pseudouridine synthase [Roseateles sp. DAIF2]|uniref:RluA family pseudouridine synthase n=1 Tax=Roseateles sp. DAIF2 TaxID=2714952 RepID=UPI0018A25549|nr:RluA family pseudouridine synthase [Roseateles sp. DAIF2]QPF74917.1 RluA family pseudouridine synthase [Roseateles sp. DAIF2]
MVEALPDPLGESADEQELEQPDEAAELRGARVEAEGHGQRLDRWLVGLAPEFSRNHLQGLIERGCVRVNGQVAGSASRKLQAGQQVEVQLLPTAESQAFRAEALPLAIVFEDKHLLVLDKAAGMVVHPAAGNWSGTVMNGLLAQHPGAAALPRAGIVHRLDKDTSGLMVVGKTLEAVTALTRMIAAREVHREYLALAHGRVPDELFIDAPLRRDPVSRVKMAVLASGKPSRTDVYCLAQAEPDGRSVSAVHCVLHSGRTHQIRVHLASRGHPLVADALYGGAAALGLARQALHAARLSFAHPIAGTPLRFDASLPQDLADSWGAAGLPLPVLQDRPL